MSRFPTSGIISPIPSPESTSASHQPAARRGYDSLLRLLFLVVSAALLSLAFAPFGQFYLAWIALAPMLLVWMGARSGLTAFVWGFCAGVMFFMPNLSYLWINSIPGCLALVVYLSLFWAVMAAIIRGGGGVGVIRRPLVSAVAVAAVWVTLDWLRGSTLLAVPWLYPGHTQSAALALCQIADIAGVHGVSFCIVLVNTLIALTLQRGRLRWREMIPAWAATTALLALVLGYGVFRLSEQQTYPGPRVLVVQPNDPMTRGGSKSVTQEQSLQFHLGATLDVLKSEHPDLIVWSETTMPPLNSEARDALRTSSSGPFLEQVHSALRGLTNHAGAGLIAGGYYVGGWEQSGGKRGTDIRNAAFFYDRTGQQAGRYDKIHLVPFGEFTPFQSSLPALHRFLLRFGPYEQEYTLNPGHSDILTVFTLTSRDDPSVNSGFVAPICFDDLDAPLLARMFRGADGGKRADFIVNLTNDGWFRWPEQQQHLQVAVFRSIENRAPTARAVNTGVSGFIDSCGRVGAVIPPRTTGTLAHNLLLDRRVTFYTRFGDVFAIVCIIATGAIVSVGVMRWRREQLGRRVST